MPGSHSARRRLVRSADMQTNVCATPAVSCQTLYPPTSAARHCQNAESKGGLGEALRLLEASGHSHTSHEPCNEIIASRHAETVTFRGGTGLEFSANEEEMVRLAEALRGPAGFFHEIQPHFRFRARETAEDLLPRRGE